MKRIIAAAAFILLAVLPVRTEPQISFTVSLVTGTPTRVVKNRTMASSLFIQMQPGTTNIGYVLYTTDAGITCTLSNTSQIVAALGPGTSTQPGSSFTYPSNNPTNTQSGGFDVSHFCVAGSTGDSMIFSFDKR